MITPTDLLQSRKHVLLDFDGPVCAVFGGLGDRTVADRLRALLHTELPADVATAKDPFDVLRYAAGLDNETLETVHREFQRLEMLAVADAPPAPCSDQALKALVSSGHTVTIVSNNSARAVGAYLTAHSLRCYVQGISSRTQSNPALLKPHPYLLDQAMIDLKTSPDHCVMIGDSVSDIHAAKQANTAIIALANKPGKRERFEQHGPDVIIDHMGELLA